MKSRRSKPAAATPTPPGFVMWNSLPEEEGARGWQRQWFGHELDPKAVFTVRGIGIREPMFNANVDRPLGTGDWLIMFFHEAPRLVPDQVKPSAPAHSLILWPTGARQFYSWGRETNVEPHSWMHVEGTWVERQVQANRLPVGIPFTLEDESLMTQPLRWLLEEMRLGLLADPIILQNLFQNWARAIARHVHAIDPKGRMPGALIRVQKYLDEHFTSQTPLDELAAIAGMSRSHLCHQFRLHFDTTISAYVTRKRMSVAQRLLFDPRLRPGEIAAAVGYADIYQFSKRFKLSFGMSPTAYRKRQTGSGKS